MHLDISGATHLGRRRTQNEDRYLVRSCPQGRTLLVVADGMGGHARGDLAAQTAVDVLAKQCPEGDHNGLSHAITRANERILRMGDEDPALNSMGTTVTASVINGRQVHWAHVGDSRLYHLHKDVLQQITTDHTFIQDFLDDGSLTPEEALKHPLRNMLDQCVGCAECAPDSGSFEVHAGDWLLVCSDGLTRHLDDGTLRSMLQSGSPAEEVAEALVQAALEGGGKDNITAIVAHFLP